MPGAFNKRSSDTPAYEGNKGLPPGMPGAPSFKKGEEESNPAVNSKARAVVNRGRESSGSKPAPRD